MWRVVLHLNANRRVHRTGVALFFCTLLVTACQWSEDRYGKRHIAASELHGTWKATAYAIESLRDVGVTDHLIREAHVLVLQADGSCQIRTTFDLPPSPNAPSRYHIYDSGCVWTLGTTEVGGRRRQELRLQMNYPPRRASFNLAEEEGQIIIWQYATDPDAWRYLEFEKSQPAA